MATSAFLLTVDWAEVMVRLIAFAARRFPEGSDEEVEDLAHEAVKRLLDPDYERTWVDPNPTQASLLRYLGSEVNGMLVNLRRLRKRRGEVTLTDEHASVLESDGPGSDARLDATTWYYEVLERLDGRQDAADLLCAYVDDFIKPAEQAEHLGWNIKRVYEARRVLKDAIREMNHAKP